MPTSTLCRAALCVVLAALAACGDSGSGTSSSTSSSAADSASANGANSLVALSSATYTVTAGSATAVVTVNRSGTSAGDIVVDYTTVNETAIAGGDYRQTSGALTWGDGDTSPKAISVPITAEGTGQEFAVTLVSISGAADFGSPTSATVVISSGGSESVSSSGAGGSSSSGSSIASSSGTGSSSGGSSGAGSSGGRSSISSAANTAPQIGLVLSCPTAKATVQFASCPGGKLVYAVPAAGVYVESSTVAITSDPAYSAATHVFQPYQDAVTVVICKLAEPPGLTVTYATDPCTMDHALVAGPAQGGSTSNDGVNAPKGSSSSSSSGGGTTSHSSSGPTSSSGTSGSGGSSSIGSGVPTAAAAVGYNTQTFGPTVTLNGNWVPWNFYGPGAQPAGAASQNSDGSLFISGLENNHYGATVSTASHSKGGKGWTGTAFGGGAYFEAVLSFTGQDNGPYNNGGPAFWALDVEHTSQGPYAVEWPGLKGYNDYFEVDFMEYDVNEYSYQNGIGNWYGSAGHGTSNPYEAVGGAAGSVLVPKGTDFSKYHKYACLWVPATPSTQGYLKFYFDDVQTGATFYWDYYNPNDPSTYPAAPPVNGSTAMSGMDWRHMLLILGTGTDQPMTVQSVSVWQASNANNLTE